MQYWPSGTAYIETVLINGNGVPITGQHPVVSIFDRGTGSELVSANSMSEIGTNGVYYYNWTTPSVSFLSNYDVLIFNGASLVKTLELIVNPMAVSSYSPGDTIRFITSSVVNGIPQTGLSSLTVDIYDIGTQTKIVSQGGMTELVAGSGIYYFDRISDANAEKTYLAVFFSGTIVLNQSSVNTISGTGGVVLTNRFTDIDTMTARVIAQLSDGFGANAVSTTEGALYINQTVDFLVREFLPIEDDFFYDLAKGNPLIQLDLINPFPFKINGAWINQGIEMRITESDYDTVQADIDNGNTVIYRYVFHKDTYKYVVLLNANPNNTYVNGLRIKGNYYPIYSVLSQTPAQLLPIEKRYDRVIEAMAVKMGIEKYVDDVEVKKWAEAWVMDEMQKAGVQNVVA